LNASPEEGVEEQNRSRVIDDRAGKGTVRFRRLLRRAL
jgi:hypothetical protein